MTAPHTVNIEHSFRAHMAAGSIANAQQGTADRFEILFIEAGEANGFTLSRQVLEASAPLWEGVPVFVDHAFAGRSVRDLGGVIFNVAFNPEFNGLTAELKVQGPSREIVLEAARILLTDQPAYPDLGFSADVIFAADGSNTVERSSSRYPSIWWLTRPSRPCSSAN
jgi:hypothetical protein